MGRKIRVRARTRHRKESLPDPAVSMTEERRGEIAVKVVKYLMYKDGVFLSEDSLRGFRNVALILDVSVEELKEFAKSLAQEFLDGLFTSLPPYL